MGTSKPAADLDHVGRESSSLTTTVIISIINVSITDKEFGMQKSPRLRPTGLRIIRNLLTLMLAVDVLALVSSALVRISGAIVTDFTAPDTEIFGPAPYQVPRANPNLELLTVNVEVAHPSLAQTILGLFAHGLALYIAAFPMILLALRLVDKAIAENPFTVSMARGLRRLGRVVLIGGLLAELIHSAAKIALYSSVIPNGHPFLDTSWMIDFWWLLTGLAILTFGQVVEHGCALRGELDEVI